MNTKLVPLSTKDSAAHSTKDTAAGPRELGLQCRSPAVRGAVHIGQHGRSHRRRRRSTASSPALLQNCTGDTRNLIEGTVSFWYRFYKGPKGTMQFGMQYSNYVRNTWRGLPTGTGADGSAQLNQRRSALGREHGLHLVPLLPAVNKSISNTKKRGRPIRPPRFHFPPVDLDLVPAVAGPSYARHPDSSPYQKSFNP